MVPTICGDGQNPYGKNYNWPDPTDTLRLATIKQKWQ